MLLCGFSPRANRGIPRALGVRSILAACLIALIARVPAAGDDSQSSPTPTIATDRPSVTDSSVVVPRWSLQAENGFAETLSEGQQTLDGPETLLRFGVLSKTELRLTVPDYFGRLGTSSNASSGFGDLLIGVKQQLGPTPGKFDVSLVLSLSLPTGAAGISSHGYDPSAQLPWSRALSANWTAAGMLSVYFLTKGTRRNITGETTFLIDRTLTKHWDAFVEYAGDFPQSSGPRNLAHVGSSYRLTPRQQVDLHFGVDLSAAAPSHFVGIGYSFLLPAFRR